MSARRSILRCRFCGGTEGTIVSERAEGLTARRGVYPMVTAYHHQQCWDAFAANETRLADERRAELEAWLAEAASS